MPLIDIDKTSQFDGKYTLERTIGEGGWGRVYAAHQHGLDRLVALKMLMPSDDQEASTRFLQEARIISAFDQKNIVQFLNYGVTADGIAYYCTELLEGQSLAEYIQKRDLASDWRDCVKKMTEVCDALSYSHAQGVIHRDLKPANIFITRSAEVKVLDFGLACFLPHLAQHQHLTTQGTLVGSLLYVSPEQAVGQPATAASDIYAVGCLLFECLAGRPPFLADRAIDVLYQHVNELPPEISTVAPQCRIPEKLEEVIRRCLHKDAGKRFQSAGDLRDSLLDVLLTSEAPQSESHSKLVTDSEARARAGAVKGRSLAAMIVASVVLVAAAATLAANTSLVAYAAPVFPALKPFMPAYIWAKQASRMIGACIQQNQLESALQLLGQLPMAERASVFASDQFQKSLDSLIKAAENVGDQDISKNICLQLVALIDQKSEVLESQLKFGDATDYRLKATALAEFVQDKALLNSHLILLGNDFLYRGAPDVAMSMFRKVEQSQPMTLEALLATQGIAMCHIENGDGFRAWALLVRSPKALGGSPGVPGIMDRIQLVAVHHYRNHQYEKTLVTATNAALVAQNFKQPRAFYWLLAANSALALKNYDLASDHYADAARAYALENCPAKSKECENLSKFAKKQIQAEKAK